MEQFPNNVESSAQERLREEWESQKEVFERAVSRAKSPDQLATIVETMGVEDENGELVIGTDSGFKDAERMASIVRQLGSGGDESLWDEGISGPVAKRLSELMEKNE
jgi:hypothetical protein